MRPQVDIIMPRVRRTQCEASWRNDPRPHLTLGRLGHPGAIVWCGSPRGLQNAVESIGRCFKRELHFDFLPYCVEDNSDLKARQFLWTIDWDYKPSIGSIDLAIGACGFGWNDGAYRLQWAWMHPYHRRCGLLSGAWPYFQQRFGSFDYEEPLSDAMEAFLKSRNQKALAGA